MKQQIVLSLLSLFFYSCSGQIKESPVSFSFAHYKNEPVNEDAYLYPSSERKGIKVTQRQLEWYLIDWNQNGKYDETGIDYYGVKSPFRSLPVISLLEETSHFIHNGEFFKIEKSSDYRNAKLSIEKSNTLISYVTDFIPFELTDGTILNNDILKGYDKTVFYLWATWCAPCIQKLIKIDALKEKLAKEKINFIPVFYKCSKESVTDLYNKKNLGFIPRELSDKSALLYQVYALSQTFVFDKDGKLISEDFDVDELK